jgi:hypothetical protein
MKTFTMKISKNAKQYKKYFKEMLMFIYMSMFTMKFNNIPRTDLKKKKANLIDMKINLTKCQFNSSNKCLNSLKVIRSKRESHLK